MQGWSHAINDCYLSTFRCNEDGSQVQFFQWQSHHNARQYWKNITTSVFPASSSAQLLVSCVCSLTKKNSVGRNTMRVNASSMVTILCALVNGQLMYRFIDHWHSYDLLHFFMV